MARSARPTLGPVADLEQHLPTDWWRTLFDAVYLKTDGDVVEDEALTRAEIDRLLEAVDLPREARVLDLCCGQGRHTLELARRGFPAVTGLDRSRYLIRLARRRARAQGLEVRFREGDARKVGQLRERFDVVCVLGNSFGYFESADEDVEVLRGIQRVLVPGGRVVLDVTDGAWMRDHFEARSWEWIDAKHFVCRERHLATDGQRLVSREVVVDSEQGVLTDRFYAERLYTPAALLRLLEGAGFRGGRVLDAWSTRSARDQDLGMMAHRILVTATAPTATARPAPPRLQPAVTVLLGDPRRPDAVKRTGAFAPEDHETVRKLQEALAASDDLRPTYVDDHGQLLDRLRADPPAFVLNLCDEGYDNDPLQELHVPALLEMLRIPYSGAGPAALGLCYDKGLVRAIAAGLDVAVPHETLVSPGDQGGALPSVFPALVKPARGDSSVGITEDSVVATPEAAIDAVERLRAAFPGEALLVQELLTGPEYTVGLLGNPSTGFTVLPILEVDFGHLPDGLPHILSYASKWDPESPYVTHVRYVPTDAPDEVQRAMVEASVRLFERLGCRDYARFDFRADADGVVKLLEVNPNPGWCWDGKLAIMAELHGWSYAELLSALVDVAQARALPRP